MGDLFQASNEALSLILALKNSANSSLGRAMQREAKWVRFQL